MYKIKCLSCNNLKYSDDVSRTKITIQGTKRQNEFLFTTLKSKYKKQIIITVILSIMYFHIN